MINSTTINELKSKCYTD